MATQHIHEIIAKLRGFKQADKGVKGLSSTMKKFATGLVTAGAAYKAFAVGLESIQLAGRLESVEKGFNNLRTQAGFSINTFSKLDKALNGTADKFTIMEQANNAMLLGIAESEDQMAEMFDVAQRLAEAVGQDATFGIESLVTGLGRQSKLMLDNLGIIVDVENANKTYAQALNKTTSQLTDQERKQAFINEAMRQGKNLVDNLGEESNSAARQIQNFSASISNLKLAIGDALIETGVLDQLDRFSEFIGRFTRTTAEDRILGINQAIEILSEKGLLGFKTSAADVFFQLENISAETRVFVTSIAQAAGTNEKAIQALNIALIGTNELYGQTNEISKEELELAEAKRNAKDIQINQDIVDIDVKKQLLDIQKQQLKQEISVFDPSRIKAYNKLKKEQTQIELDNTSAQLKGIKDIATALNADRKTMEALTIAHASADAFAGANKAFAQGGVTGFITGAAILAQGIANVNKIKDAYSKKQGQTGFEGVIDEPTQFTVGEGGAAEYVSVTPLEGVNNAGGGQGMTINITGNVMSQEFVNEELPSKIQEAVRQGIDFGIV